MTANKNVTEVVSKIVSLLSPLESEERLRVVQASLVLLGESNESGKVLPQSKDEDPSAARDLSARTRSWIKQNDLSADQLQQVFHLTESGAEVIAAEIPGKNNREKVRNAYVLLGIANWLSSGDAKFDDKAARALCELFGVYDQTNHMKYMKGGNEFVGSKAKGWTLTRPGFKHGSVLVKQLGETK